MTAASVCSSKHYAHALLVHLHATIHFPDNGEQVVAYGIPHSKYVHQSKGG